MDRVLDAIHFFHDPLNEEQQRIPTDPVRVCSHQLVDVLFFFNIGRWVVFTMFFFLLIFKILRTNLWNFCTCHIDNGHPEHDDLAATVNVSYTGSLQDQLT